MTTRRHNKLRAIAAIIATWLLIILCLHQSGIGKDDPTSIFFDASTAYKQRYSHIRQREAFDFIHNVDKPSASFRRDVTTDAPFMCIGMPTVMRGEKQYLKETVGSLFHGMTNGERQEIVFLAFIAHTDPVVHEAYTQRWLNATADRVLVYDESVPNYDLLRILEQQQDFWNKAILDYIYVLEKCHATGAPYVAIIEDDVLALDGWYHRTKAGLKRLNTGEPYLYLRLFYSEEFLGWQSYNAPVYIINSLVFTCVMTSIIFLMRSKSATLRKHLHSESLPLILFCVGNCAIGITLFFLIGKTVVSPPRTGVVRMDEGCCGQSMVYPRSVVPGMVEYFHKVKDGHADRRTTEYAEQTDLTRYALVPSVFQHIGSSTSHEEDKPEEIKHDRSLAEQVHNFQFENNEQHALHLEHLAEVGATG